MKLNAYFDRFSDRDFAAIEQAAIDVFKQAGIEEIDEKKPADTAHQENTPMYACIAAWN